MPFYNLLRVWTSFPGTAQGLISSLFHFRRGQKGPGLISEHVNGHYFESCILQRRDIPKSRMLLTLV